MRLLGVREAMRSSLRPSTTSSFPDLSVALFLRAAAGGGALGVSSVFGLAGAFRFLVRRRCAKGVACGGTGSRRAFVESRAMTVF